MFFLERFLVWMDKSITRLFKKSFDLKICNLSFDSGAREEFYFIDKGKKLGILNENGRIRYIIGYFAVCHEYGTDGRFKRRRVMRKNLNEGERIISGRELRMESAKQSESMRRRNMLIQT